MNVKITLPAILATLFLSLPALAHDYTHNGLSLDHPWARPTPPGLGVGGGFITIKNDSGQDDTLLGARADFTHDVQIHETRQNGDVMSMQHRPEGLTVPAGESRSLKPGSYHLMFMGLKAPLIEGERVPVTLMFEHAGDVTVEFSVERDSDDRDHDME